VNASVPPLPSPGPVRRLTFGYDGDRVSLVSERHVQLIVPPTQPLDRAESDSGFTVILRDAEGKPLYRLTRTSPMRHDAEVFSETGDRTVERVGLDRPNGAFTVLVPDIEGAETVELFGHPMRPQAHLEQPRSLASFRLRSFEHG
jgi:hypothetical protein